MTLNKIKKNAKIRKQTRTLINKRLCIHCRIPLKAKDTTQRCAFCKNQRIQNTRNRTKQRVLNKLCTSCGKEVKVNQVCTDCWFKIIALKRTGSRTNWSIIKQLLESQSYKCAYSGKELIPGINASLDHKIPTSRGGTNEPSNLQWVDLKINKMKNNYLHEEFLQVISNILSYAGMQPKP
jgi:hypothetical protein